MSTQHMHGKVAVKSQASFKLLMLMIGLTLMTVHLEACSKESKNAVAANEQHAESVVIIREVKPEFPAAYIKAMRQIQEACIDARAERAKMMSKAYEPANDRWTDDDILMAGAGRIEEYFKGSQYAIYESHSQVDWKKLDPVDPALNCKPPIETIKTVDIKTLSGAKSCTDYRIEYADKKRIRITAPLPQCRQKEAADQAGDVQDVAGTAHQCKWSAKVLNVQGKQVPLASKCTLLPSPIHAGTGRMLVAISKLPDNFRLDSNPAVQGAGNITTQSYSMIEKAVEIKINTPIVEGKFKEPLDSMAFELEEVK